jgi:hypothetical protein
MYIKQCQLENIRNSLKPGKVVVVFNQVQNNQAQDVKMTQTSSLIPHQFFAYPSSAPK